MTGDMNDEEKAAEIIRLIDRNKIQHIGLCHGSELSLDTYLELLRIVDGLETRKSAAGGQGATAPGLQHS